MSLTEEKEKPTILPRWIEARLIKLSNILYSIWLSRPRKPYQPSEPSEPAWIQALVKQQEEKLLEPKLYPGTGEIFDHYCVLRRIFSKEEITEIFIEGENAACLKKRKVNLKQVVGNIEKYNKALSQGYETVGKILMEELGTTTKEESMEELVRELENYGKSKPFWPK
ncbi:MAG: hypothetical protein QXL86_01335 [Candidatus Aenigmatarchaeota archaeon]